MAESSQSEIKNIERALPTTFIERLKKQLHHHEYKVALESFDNPKPVTIRSNTLRSSESKVLQEVSNAGMTTIPIPWCPGCHLLTNGTIRKLQELPSWDNGGLYIQAASSMLAAHALQVEPGMRVLDMCAAPGSKTSQIAALMENRGMLVANDRSRKRLYRLREILQKQGATSAEVLCGPGERLGQTHADCFDRVLVDAPCSGEGRFRMDRPIRLSRWSVQEVRTLAKLQEQLLVAAMRCVCAGGLVVYSTCTFSPEENEIVLDKVLSRKSINAQVVPIPTHLRPPTATNLITNWGEVEVKHDVSNAIRIIPDNTTTGFFIACLKRLS
ncbi:MAG: RsmB/NOP family class I SAM-dependent RNA methyltransferase [Phycisphaerales bacterium]|nr:RsmB/NOP family class I SAM-dependent RNA methyltransferase [Planctomycetota bacterium]MBL6997762.1 RsmB/NOP family class I SAM-dependent RNA methyltransferase [Phycisphaerales bacterium]